MRSFLLAILLFALMLTGITLNTIFLHRLCTDMLNALAALPELSDGQIDAANRIAARWAEARSVVSLSVSDNTVNRIDDGIAALCTQAATGTDADYTLARERLRLLIEELRDYEMPTWENLI